MKVTNIVIAALLGALSTEQVQAITKHHHHHHHKNPVHHGFMSLNEEPAAAEAPAAAETPAAAEVPAAVVEAPKKADPEPRPIAEVQAAIEKEKENIKELKAQAEAMNPDRPKSEEEEKAEFEENVAKLEKAGVRKDNRNELKKLEKKVKAAKKAEDPLEPEVVAKLEKVKQQVKADEVEAAQEREMDAAE